MKVRFNKLLYDLEYSCERYHLHDAVNDVFIDVSSEIEFEDEIQELEVEVEAIHKSISNQDFKDLDTRIIDGLVDSYSFEIVKKDLKELLLSNGYEVNTSNVSLSLYVTNDNNEQVRIADHKRPAFTTNGLDYQDHEYKYQLINKEGAFTKKDLENVGIKIKEDGMFYL